MNFEEIVRKSSNNIAKLWSWLALSLQNQKSPLNNLSSWLLDTDAVEGNRMIYWS